jgi:hypothetical protein
MGCYDERVDGFVVGGRHGPICHDRRDLTLRAAAGRSTTLAGSLEQMRWTLVSLSSRGLTLCPSQTVTAPRPHLPPLRPQRCLPTSRNGSKQLRGACWPDPGSAWQFVRRVTAERNEVRNLGWIDGISLPDLFGYQFLPNSVSVRGDLSLEPAFQLEPDQGNERAENDNRPAVLIAPSPIVFRHVLEVHAIDPRHQRRGDADDRDDG